MENLEKRIAKIEERNLKVEADKAWETSLLRKIVITILTYLVVLSFFLISNSPNPFTNAIVPTLGYFLSTLSFEFIKKSWLKSRKSS